jgi:hypothetical protein
MPFGVLKSAVFSRDGRFVITAHDDQTARVWDAATGSEVHVLRHNAGVQFAIMTPDSRHVATASGTLTHFRSPSNASRVNSRPWKGSGSASNEEFAALQVTAPFADAFGQLGNPGRDMEHAVTVNNDFRNLFAFFGLDSPAPPELMTEYCRS